MLFFFLKFLNLMGISCKMLHRNEVYVFTLSPSRSKLENIFKIRVYRHFTGPGMLHLQNGFTNFSFLSMVFDMKIWVICIMCILKQQLRGMQFSRNCSLQLSGVIDKKKLREYGKNNFFESKLLIQNLCSTLLQRNMQLYMVRLGVN